MNASRVDSIRLQATLVPDTQLLPARGNAHVTVYATNHNVFRVVNGFGGLVFTV